MFDINNINKMEDIIGINFNKKKLLIEALTHHSYLLEEKCAYGSGFTGDSNKRLEYLGDSILGFAIAEKLHFDHPGREGNIGAVKAHYLSGKKLDEISDKTGLENFLLVGDGELKNKFGREKRIAVSLKALIGS